jgi:ribokinase
VDYNSLGNCPELPHSEWIHVPGLVEARLLAGRLSAVRETGSLISVSGSWAPVELDMLRKLDDRPFDLLVLNSMEAMKTGADQRNVLLELQGAARSVIITEGKDGAYGILNGEPFDVAAPSIEAEETTGAGDAFCAGLLAALVRGCNPGLAMGFAVRVAGRQLRQRGGVVRDPGTFSDLREWLERRSGGTS